MKKEVPTLEQQHATKTGMGKDQRYYFGVIAAPLLILIMVLASIFDQRAFKKERN